MPSIFDSRVHFNGEAFAEYKETIPYTHKHELIKSGALVINNDIKDTFKAQTGAFIATVPYKGSIMDAVPVKYDGKTDIPSSNTKTYSGSRVVVGYAAGFTANDFVYDLTAGGYDEAEVEAEQVNVWEEKWDERILYAEITGIYAGPFSNNNHTYDITAITNSEGLVGRMDATTLNTSMQRACGDNKGKFSLAIMPSQVATNLENLGLLTYIKYNDAYGMQRDTSFATINGKLVLVDDDVPTLNDESTATYAKTSDVAIDDEKTYYTRSGSSPNYVYTKVEDPVVSDIGSYYEQTYAGDTIYQTFIFGNGAIEYTDCGVMVPYELERNASKNGGMTTLYVRKRICIAPKGFSFTGANNLASECPDIDELADGNNWGMVKSADGSVISDKSIAMARILSKG